jgi:hypothetical protein
MKISFNMSSDEYSNPTINQTNTITYPPLLARQIQFGSHYFLLQLQFSDVRRFSASHLQCAQILQSRALLCVMETLRSFSISTKVPERRERRAEKENVTHT